MRPPYHQGSVGAMVGVHRFSGATGFGPTPLVPHT